MSLTTLRDRDLVALAADGDRDAFTALYQRHVDTVHDHVTRWTGDPALAADATQEAFVTLLDRLETVRDGQAVLAWLMRTARNRAVDQLRRVGRERATATTGDQVPTALLTAIDPDRAGTPERAAEATEAATMLWSIAAGLDERTFTVLDLTVRHGLNGPELAGVLDTTPQNANVLVHRMRERVRALFGATLLVREGARDCPDLTALRATLPDPLDLPAARAVEAHADACVTCEPRRRRAIAPMRSYAAFAEVRAPAAVRIGIEAAVDAAFAPPTSGSTWRRVAAVTGGAVLVLALGSTLVRPADGGPTPTATAVALGGDPTEAASPREAAPSDPPTVTPDPAAAPTEVATTSASEQPDVDPTQSATAPPTEAPTERVPPEPLAVTIDSPLPETIIATSVPRDDGRDAARVTLAATVTGLGGVEPATLEVRWSTPLREGALLDELRGDVALRLSAPCTDTTHDLTVLVSDPSTGRTATSTMSLGLTHMCPDPLVAQVLRPATDTEVDADRVDPATGRQTAEVAVLGEAEDADGVADPGTWTYAWTSDQAPGTTLLTAASGRIELWAEGCTPLSHVVTVTVTDPDTGATGSDSIVVTVNPACRVP